MATTFLKIENLSESTLNGAVLAGDATIEVQTGGAAIFGGANFNYHLVVGDTSQGHEIMTVTGSGGGEVLNVNRAVENVGGAAGVALPFDDGTAVRMAITDEYMQAAYDAINNIEDGTTVLTTVSTTGFIIAGGTALKYGSDDAEVQGANGYLGLVRDSAGDNGPALVGLKSDADGAVTDNALLLSIFGLGHDGGDYNTVGAKIIMQVDGAVAANKVPTEILFHTALGAVADDVALAMTLDKNKDLTVVGDIASVDVTASGNFVATGDAINDSAGAWITSDGAANTTLAGTLHTVDDAIIGGTALKRADADLEVQGNLGKISFVNDAAGDSGVQLVGLKSDNNGIVTDDAKLLDIFGYGHDGGDYFTQGAIIRMTINGAPAANRMPTDIEFWTAAGAADNDIALAMTIGKDKSLTPTGNYVMTNGRTFKRGVAIIQSAVVSHDSGSPLALFTVADGYAITDVYAEVTETWDGNGTVTLGDGTVATGYATDAKLDTGNAGYKLANFDDRGGFLWDAANSHAQRKVYTGADTIDATIVAGTSTQGEMTVWVVIQRLK